MRIVHEVPEVRYFKIEKPQAGATWGSTPREAGSSMLVGENRGAGTIGGGQIEFRAIATVRLLRIPPREVQWIDEREDVFAA